MSYKGFSLSTSHYLFSMKYKVFIGIDVSKLTIDAHLHEIGASKKFSNEEKGFASLLSWVKKYSKQSEPAEMIICFEHTGSIQLNLPPI